LHARRFLLCAELYPNGEGVERGHGRPGKANHAPIATVILNDVKDPPPQAVSWRPDYRLRRGIPRKLGM